MLADRVHAREHEIAGRWRLIDAQARADGERNAARREAGLRESQPVVQRSVVERSVGDRRLEQDCVVDHDSLDR